MIRVADRARLDEALPDLAELSSGEEPLVDAAAGEVRVAVTDAAVSAEAVRRLDARRLPIAAIEVQRPTLDDVFMTLTGHRADTETTQEAA